MRLGRLASRLITSLHVGRSAWNDWSLVAYAVAEDLILVTNNAADFRALYARKELHSGLVIIVPNLDRATQLGLFRFTLSRLAEIADLANKVLEVSLGADGAEAKLYDWPNAPL